MEVLTGLVCEHCGVKLNISSSSKVRGFLLCKLCRQVEVELYTLGREEFRLVTTLKELNTLQQFKMCECRAKRIRSINSALVEVISRREYLEAEWESLVL